MVLGAEVIKNPMFTFGSERKNLLQIGGSASFRGGMEAISGKLKLLVSREQSRLTQHVILKLYAAVPCPFAVVFPDKFACPKHCGLIQLKDFSVEVIGERDFTVVIKNGTEGGRYLRFSADSCAERNYWVNAFQQVAQSTPRKGNCNKTVRQNINGRLPSLAEVSEEVEIQEEEEEEEAERRQEGRTVVKNCKNLCQDNANRWRPLTPRRRVVEVPVLEQISEEEESDSEMDLENRIVSSSRRRSSLKDCLTEVSSRGGRSL